MCKDIKYKNGPSVTWIHPQKVLYHYLIIIISVVWEPPLDIYFVDFRVCYYSGNRNTHSV